MSKTQLQTNNTKYSQLIESLRGKATGGEGSLETVEFSLQTSIPYIICYNTIVDGVVTREHYIKTDTTITNDVFTALKGVWLDILFQTYGSIITTINGGEHSSLEFLFGSNIRCERVKFEQDGSVSFTANSSGWD